MIHPMACVHPEAKLHPSVKVGPYAVIYPQVKIEKGCEIGPHAIIGYDHVYVELGENNKVYPRATLGIVPFDLGYKPGKSQLIIGDDNIFREETLIHPGSVKQDNITRIGNKNFIGMRSHLAHDVVMGNNNIILADVVVAGHTSIEDHVAVASKVSISPLCHLGSYSFVAWFTWVHEGIYILPYVTYGDKKRLYYINAIGLKKRGFSRQKIAEINDIYKQVMPKLLRLEKTEVMKILKEKNTEESQVIAKFLEAVPEDKLKVQQ